MTTEVIVLTKGELEVFLVNCLSAVLRSHVPTQPSGIETREFVSTKEASKLLNCSTRHIGHMVERGELTKYKQGRSTRFRREDVLKLFQPA